MTFSATEYSASEDTALEGVTETPDIHQLRRSRFGKNVLRYFVNYDLYIYRLIQHKEKPKRKFH